MRRFLTPALAFVLAAAPSLAEAQRAGGWRDTLDPGRRTGREFLRAGLVLLLDAMGPDEPELGDSPPYLLLNQALIRFERAHRRMPDDPEVLFYTAYALTIWTQPSQDGGQDRRVDEAIDAWQALRAAHPTYFPDVVARTLADLHLARQEFALARAELEAALRHNVPPIVVAFPPDVYPSAREERLAGLFLSPERGGTHYNLAEAAMLTGDLAAAVQHYRRAREDTSSPLTHVLASWGLALALDRTGAHEDAITVAREAMDRDPTRGDPRFLDVVRAHGPFAALHREGVSFEPRCEIHAYEALGHEALSRSPGEEGPNDHLQRALRSWRFFLAEGGNASRFAPIARRHVETLAGGLEQPEPRARVRRSDRRASQPPDPPARRPRAVDRESPPRS